MKSKINGQNKALAEMVFLNILQTAKNSKSSEIYQGLEKRTDESIKLMQDKYSTFTKQILEVEKNTQVEYQKYISEMQAIRGEFQR